MSKFISNYLKHSERDRARKIYGDYNLTCRLGSLFAIATESAISINWYLEKGSLIGSETARHVHLMHIFTASVAVIWLTNLQAGRMRGCVTHSNMGIFFSHMLTHIPLNTHLPREKLIIDCFFFFVCFCSLTFYYCLLLSYPNEHPGNKAEDIMLLLL